MTEDVPGYRVLERVGEGGFSVVYRAHQERLDRMVALKVLSISTVDEVEMRRFQRESKITGRLSGHPNIVTVLDTGTTRSGRPYIAMEYFEQGALTDRLRVEGPLPIAEVLRIGVKMASALAATHETDVLHRDVKPQNILVSRYGEPALGDFGIARLVDSFDATHTQAFTPHHASPEVLEGKPPGVGADIYSLGSTLYQLLAGQPAFKGPKGEGIALLMLRILNDPPPPIPRNDLPRPVAEAIGRAMAKKPEQRFASALEFAHRLQQIQSDLGLPITDLAHSSGSSVFPRSTGPHPIGGSPSEGTPTTPGSTVAPDEAAPAGLSPWRPGASFTVQDRADSPAAHPRAALPQVEKAPDWPATHGGGEPATAPGAADGDGPRRGLVVAAAVALVGGLGLGVGALALAGGDEPAKKTSTVPTSPASAGKTAQEPIPEEQFKATRPFNVRARRVGTRAALTWGLPESARRLTILVQPLPAGSAQTIPAGQGAKSAAVPQLDPKRPYCFRVGALLRLNQDAAADVSWSQRVCVRAAAGKGKKKN
ncbi:protein kinase domain-containing protein [Spirillospora sp. CA-294931]|uniref:serine/threonine-protein kinase n=1 Tax=Spirillospora sp. CA-294931 TaxID=3240042 RepID=UPI003D90A454